MLESEWNTIYYNDESYGMRYDYWQSENPLTVGKHNIPVSVLGYETTAVVEIIESPVASVKVEPVKVIKNTGGYWTTRWDENDNEVDYFYYYLDFNYTVTFKDGTVTETSGDVFYNDEYYSLEENYIQSEKPFTVGKNNIPVSIMGYETTAVFEVVETPVKSIKIEPKKVIKNTEGHWTTSRDDNGNKVEFFYYYLYLDEYDYTVTLKDGTVIEDDYGYVEYAGKTYGLDTDYIQSDKPLAVGKNNIPAFIMGYETTAVFEIIESPVASVKIEPVTIIENTNGYWDSYEDENGNEKEYYEYNLWSNDFNFTVTLKDGTVLKSKNGYVDYNNKSYSILLNSNQSENPFKLGKNNVPCDILGFSTTVVIEIVESPVAKIEIAPATIEQYTRGYWDYSWTDNDEYEYYYSYEDFSPLKYTVTLKDGTVLTGRCYNSVYNNGIEYAGFEYPIYISYDNNLTVGKNNINIEILGKEATAVLEIVAAKETFKYNEFEDGIVITGMTDRSVKTITIPSTINNKPVIGIAYLGAGNVKEIVVSDSVKFLSKGWLSNCRNVEKVTIGSAVEQIGVDIIEYGKIKNIEVSANNPNFKSIDGIVYSKDGKTLIVYPIEKGYTYNVPATVANIDVLFDYDIYTDVEIVIPATSTNFVTVDGVTYNADKTKILFSDKEKTGNYVMPDTVTSINNYAFEGSKIESLTISKNVNEIVYGVFANCSSLKTVTMPDSVKTIKYSAFSNCEALKTVTLSKSLEFIGSYVFRNCKSLNQISLPEGLKTMGDSVFTSSGLTSVVLPGSITEMGEFVFEYCKDLKSVKISDGLKEIPAYSFYDCEALDTITVPDSVEYIGYAAFANTAYIKKAANYKDGMLYIGNVLYTTNDKVPATVTIADGTASVANGAFAGNSNITKVVFPASLKYIDYAAFSNCENLVSAELPEGIEYIGMVAFYNTAINSVKIPSTVTDIVYRAFAESDVAKIDMPDTLVTIDDCVFDGTAWYDAQPDGAIYLGKSLYDYKGKMPENTELVVKDGTLLISNNAVGSYTNLKSVVLPEGLVEIGHHAFYHTEIESITIPSSVEKIGDSAFADCYMLESVIIPPTVKEIGYRAFGSWFDSPIVIYGAKGSAAETFAVENSLKFIEMQFTSNELVVPDNNSNITVKDTVANVTPEMSVTAFVESVDNEKVRVLTADGKELAKDAFLGTGTKIQVLDTDGTVLSEYEVMVKSDLDGDGKINPADARLALRAAAGIDAISGVYETAANYDDKDSVSPADARMILRKSVGLE